MPPGHRLQGSKGRSGKLSRFPRRIGIRTKLGIAFVLLSIVPLALAAGLATWHTVTHLRAMARVTLEHDLEAAAVAVEQSLAQADADVHHLTLALLEPVLVRGRAVAWDRVAKAASEFLSRRPTLLQVKLINADGTVLMFARASSLDTLLPSGGDDEGLLYAVEAERAQAGEHLIVPVELRGRPAPSGRAVRIPVVAILMPLRAAGGGYRGVVVGEALAGAIFASLEHGSPSLPGTTGLVDADGLYLYHSERKRDWAGLAAERSELDLREDFSPSEARSLLSGKSGTLANSGGRIVVFIPLHIGASGTGPLTLYRSLPLVAVDAPVRRFLVWVVLAGSGVIVLVVLLGVAAANRFTRPIYELRQAVARLARGEPPTPLAVATNDELQDLAVDFSAMAASLTEYRRHLEELVAERTRILRETHAELADVLAHSADAIVGLDPQGSVRVWNRGAEVLFGYGPPEVLGRNADSLLLPRDPAAKREIAFIQRELDRSGAVVNLRTRRVAKNGEVIPVSLTQTRLRNAGDPGDNPTGSSLILRDNRLQERLEEQMRRSEHLAVVSVLAAGLAHEINNPLGIIVNRVECMERAVANRCPGCFLDNDLRVLREHSTRLGDVTRNLLRFAREDDAEPSPVDLSRVGPRIAQLLERTFAMRNVQLEVRSDPDLPPVWGNEKAIETVCLNLLLNALDATPGGGVVTVEARRSASGDGVALEVSDTGIGIAPELQARLFEPFFTTKGAKGGTGLGLAVCRRIAERHGGSISLESQQGRGSRFTVSLPARSPEVV